MAVKEAETEGCNIVRIRRHGVSGRYTVHLESSSQPPTWASRRSGAAVDGIPPVTSRPISPLLSSEESEDFPNTSMHDQDIASRKDEIDYRGLSIDWILDSPYNEVFELLKQLELRDYDLFMQMILHYSLIIRGLPDCPVEDLFLAVYFFIEDTFNIQSRLNKCVKIGLHDGKMDVGVMFDSIRMKYNVLRKDELLKDTGVRIVNNDTLAWFKM